MKTRMLFFLLLTAYVGGICTTAYCQDRQDTAKELIADETWVKFYNADAKITTTLESAFQEISLRYGEQFTKVLITYKHANKQQYKEYVITVPKEIATDIKQWAKKHL